MEQNDHVLFTCPECNAHVAEAVFVDGGFFCLDCIDRWHEESLTPEDDRHPSLTAAERNM